jgi:predicted 3-demethylubiquinone-9 3-methyltransferase (glyoxalase superfamily)
MISRYGKEGRDIHHQPEGKVMTVAFRLGGLDFLATNGGPLFTFNPSISYYVVCESMDEIKELWKTLMDGGSALMPLDKYDWSEQYGWLKDRYGLTWQLTLGKVAEVGQKIIPAFMFVQQQFGKAEEAIQFYTSIFRDSAIATIHKYDQGELAGKIMHSRFTLAGQTYMAMDGPGAHDFNFNEAIAIVVNCETQEEIDYYWGKLTTGGQESSCGWLKDKFGVSWEVTPSSLGRMLTDPDREKVDRVTKAFLKMKKFDIAALERAYAGNS